MSETGPVGVSGDVSAGGLPVGGWSPDRLTYLGLVSVALAAAIMSFSALSGLATMVGIDGQVALGLPDAPGLLELRAAWLLPIAIDMYGLIAIRVWLSGEPIPPSVRRHAQWDASCSIGLSVAANVAYHWIDAADVTVAQAWWLIPAVGAIAPAVLGRAVHLVALMRQPPAADRSADVSDRSEPAPSEPVPVRPTVSVAAVVEPVRQIAARAPAAQKRLPPPDRSGGPETDERFLVGLTDDQAIAQLRDRFPDGCPTEYRIRKHGLGPDRAKRVRERLGAMYEQDLSDGRPA